MGLNGRGYISLVQIIAYIPVLALAGFLVYRNGVRKTQGWIYLVIFALSKFLLLLGLSATNIAFLSSLQLGLLERSY